MTREEAIELLCYGDWLNVISEHIGKQDTERIAKAMCIVGKALRADLARVTAERDAAVKDLNEFLAMDELCPIQCEWCKWNDTFCDGKTPEWRGQKED